MYQFALGAHFHHSTRIQTRQQSIRQLQGRLFNIKLLVELGRLSAIALSFPPNALKQCDTHVEAQRSKYDQTQSTVV